MGIEYKKYLVHRGFHVSETIILGFCGIMLDIVQWKFANSLGIVVKIYAKISARYSVAHNHRSQYNFQYYSIPFQFHYLSRFVLTVQLVKVCMYMYLNCVTMTIT